MAELKINLSLSGGGIRGIAQVGAIAALEEEGIEIAAIAGSSVGAIIAVLYGAGYSLAELKNIVFTKDFKEFQEGFILFKFIRLLRKYGLYSGDNFLKWIKEKLEKKGIDSFADFPIEVKVVASEVSWKKSIVFSKSKTPQFPVAEAVRMSMGLPIIYSPYQHLEHLYVDGGVMNNLPLQVFNNSKLPTLGLRLVEAEAEQAEEINNIFDYLKALVEMMILVNQQRQIELSQSRVIAIPTGTVAATDFALSLEQKQLLYGQGYKYVKKNLDRFTDRRLTESGLKTKEVKASIVELEELAQEMAEFILTRVDLDGVDSILAWAGDDYLFSYLVASYLKKNFSIVEVKAGELSYNYNTVNAETNFLLVSFKSLEGIFELTSQLPWDKVQGIFSYFDLNSEDSKKEIIEEYQIPYYLYGEE